MRARRGWIGKAQDRFRFFVERSDLLRREIDRLEACIRLLEGTSIDGSIASEFRPALRSAPGRKARDNRVDAAVIDWIAAEATASLKPASIEDTEEDSAAEQVMAFASASEGS